jgi:hypothetical protein
MKAAVCIVLTLALISLPTKQVLAQTSPEASRTADGSRVSEQVSQSGPEVSALTPPAALLWQPIAENHAGVLEESPFDPAPVRGWSDWTTEKRAWVVGGVVVGLLVLGIVSIG